MRRSKIVSARMTDRSDACKLTFVVDRFEDREGRGARLGKEHLAHSGFMVPQDIRNIRIVGQIFPDTLGRVRNPVHDSAFRVHQGQFVDSSLLRLVERTKRRLPHGPVCARGGSVRFFLDFRVACKQTQALGALFEELLNARGGGLGGAQELILGLRANDVDVPLFRQVGQVGHGDHDRQCDDEG